MSNNKSKKNWKAKLHEIIYEADTAGGKLFDIILLLLIVTSIIIVMLQSVREIDATYHNLLEAIEWIVTILFTIEYILRIITIKKPLKYIFSFYGIIDLLSILPLYISFLGIGTSNLVAIRALRLLRIFKIFKLASYIGEANRILLALRASRARIMVFLVFVLILCVILGTIMFIVEGNENGFTSIPRSVYWAIVTLTTVGYGDISPHTALGQFIASVIMILGYSILAIPTGIVSHEMSKKRKIHTNTQACTTCSAEGHHDNAKFCYNCGSKLN